MLLNGLSLHKYKKAGADNLDKSQVSTHPIKLLLRNLNQRLKASTATMNGHSQSAGNNGLFTLVVFLSLALTLLTVVLSAYIRLSESGLSCQPWPACYGSIGIELEPQGIEVLQGANADVAHRGARLVHRLVASALGVFVVLVFVLALRRRRQGEPGLLAAFLLLVTTVSLAVLGYSTPTRVLPWITLGNLGGGMLMLALLWWLGQRSVSITTATTPATPIPAPTRTVSGLSRRSALVAVVLVAVQILSGAWVSANFAATACINTLLCTEFWAGSQAWADSLNVLRELLVNNQGMIQMDQTGLSITMLHRLLAMVTCIYLGWISWSCRRETAPVKITGNVLAVFLLLEVLLGILSVYNQLPISLVTLHNTVAALLLLTTINLVHHLTGGAGSRSAPATAAQACVETGS